MKKSRPNILYLMCDQFRYDCIAALGNSTISTPNLDRLVKRGVSFENAYSTCPVCIPARYSIRTGRESYSTGCYCNEKPITPKGKTGAKVEDWTGPYLAKELTALGYRTFGIGKFHTFPEVYEELGYELQIHTEEMWDTPQLRARDGFSSYIEKEHPEYKHIEQLHGERTNMYYVPQISPFPAEHTVEGFVAKKTVEQLEKKDTRPYFGFVSFVGPHPPCAPPIPFNRMYDPDGMENPYRGSVEDDHFDEQIPWMNYIIYADEINDAWARNLRTRYFGEITYIDSCIGKILDAVEERADADNTMICFFADHGDMLGDHQAWQKESFYESSVKVPFIVSYPPFFEMDTRSKDLVSLTDLFGLATKMAGKLDIRDGIDLLQAKREYLFSFYGRPETRRFKVMVRNGNWKYIFMANGNREQLFDLEADPLEMRNLVKEKPETALILRSKIAEECASHPDLQGMVKDNDLISYSFEARKLGRLHQFAFSRNITDFTVPSGKGFMSEALPN